LRNAECSPTWNFEFETLNYIEMATKKVTYKEAITEIEDILEKIENEELDVDELSEQVNRVSALINICKDKLHKTEAEVEKILNDMNQ
jgi:exodeoxyribonuclease VII small subunit